MRSLFSFLKSIMPNGVSLRLRLLKAKMVDSDTAAFAKFVNRVVDRTAIAIDVGANSGLYSAILAKHFDKIVTIEPNPDCVRYMQDALPSNCQIFQCAASDQSGHAVLRIPMFGGTVETTRATISDDNTFSSKSPTGFSNIEVITETVDNISKYIVDDKPVAILKIDTEGHEFAAFLGAERIIAKHKPALCIEIEGQHGVQAVKILNKIADLGYIGIILRENKFQNDARFSDGRFQEILADTSTANRYFVHRNKVGIFPDIELRRTAETRLAV
jgi:FkbM family methyltransferase